MPSDKRRDRGLATRATLVAVGRRLFAEQGFAGTSIDDLVSAADVTRGALYHHFADKESLFRAVFEELEAELCADVVKAAGKGADPLDSFQRGVRAFLRACLDPAVQRIVLVDGPSVLGWDTWQDIEAEYGLAVIRAGLQEAMDAGAIQRQPVDALAHLVLGALNHGSMLLARSKRPHKLRAELEETMVRLVRGMA